VPSDNKTDYMIKFMDLLELLPEPYQSDVNISVVNNLFNRFLTKKETVRVSGYIGVGNQNALTPRRIKENDIHRQAFQLQPILYDKIGTIEHMASWKDIQNETTRLGINIDDFATWGASETFNWVPPIDINKIINYRDYYWVDTVGSQPQYITVRSRCAVATSLANFWGQIITQYGELFPITEIREIDDTSALQTYSIVSINTGTGNVVITGDATTDIVNGNFFNISSTLNNNGTYQVNMAPVYDGVTNTTTLDVSGLIADENIGLVTLRRYDKLVIGPNDNTPTGDYSTLFEEGFVFFMRQPTNPEQNNQFVTVISSTFDPNNANTIVKIGLTTTDNTVAASSMVSLVEQNAIYVDARNCQCGVGVDGWDDGVLWDDNPSNPIWGDAEGALGSPIPDGISDYQNLINRISNAGPPALPGIQNELWFDTIGDILYQYDTVGGWKIIWNSFSTLLSDVTGQVLWDLSQNCDEAIRIPAMDQWILENKWVHKNDITNFASVRRATQPIIEYDWDLELNEWTFTKYRWGYRSETNGTFIETTELPPFIELEEIVWWELDTTDITNSTVILDSRYGDQSACFAANTRFHIGNTIINEVDYVEYKKPSIASMFPYRTYVKFKTPIVGSTGDFSIGTPNSLSLTPVVTKQGDLWGGYGVHWIFLGANDTVPVPHQTDNPDVAILDTALVSTIGSPPIYETRESLYAQEFQLLAPSTTILELSNIVPTNDTRSLQRKALYNFDDIRVYLSDITNGNIVRQFGTYEEIGEVVVDIIGIDDVLNEFIIGEDYSTLYTAGDTIRLQENNTVGTQDYTVAGGASNPNRIRVTTALAGISITGQIVNISNPVTTELYPNIDFVNTRNISIYVRGIRFLTPVLGGQNVTIEVGEASINELDRHALRVRTIEDEAQYNIVGDLAISTIKYRKVEQVKTSDNQYPLFDIFTATGEAANRANPIFGYKTSNTAPINQTGLRIVFDASTLVYEFDQFILDADNSELFAYRDYSNKKTDFWYNPETNEMLFWHGTEWSSRTAMSEHYRNAVISSIEPSLIDRAINGLYWYNTTTNTLFIRSIDPISNIGTWNPILDIDTTTTDTNLQTIWKGGLNNDQYVPERVDWLNRTNSEYNTEMSAFIDGRVNTLLTGDTTLSIADATTQASIDWFTSQENVLSPTGIWVGDWEIPDPLYHNNLHENKKCITSRDLLTHFTTIIESQPTIPGFNGDKNAMFNLIPTTGVNFALGGTIKEFNDGFDTFLSSTFVNNVTPRRLIEFAHDQYESLLNSIKESYRANAVRLFTDLSPNNIVNISGYISNEIIAIHELNDAAAFIYGDSTTFNDIPGANDLGVRNWIATLPYLRLLHRRLPVRIINEVLSLDEIIHHDGHRGAYSLTDTAENVIVQLIINTDDNRNGIDTLGRNSIANPPNNIADFAAEFNTDANNRGGVYWWNTTTSILYRYTVAESGTNTPILDYPDGTLWMDLTLGNEVLRIKSTSTSGVISWDVADGLSVGDGRFHNGTTVNDFNTATVSTWQEVNLNNLLGDLIFELETRLYNNAPNNPQLSYNTSLVETTYPNDHALYLEQAFLDHVSQLNIQTPYQNTAFNISDPFTWNYKHSAGGGGFAILEADGLTNSFLISGNQLFFFDPCSASATGSPITYPACVPGGTTATFYIKNSGGNDGIWTTLSSTVGDFTAFYDILTNTTRIFVQGNVMDDATGIIHIGLLPSQISSTTPNNLNDGSESGGDWRDLYTKLYNTPYPNLEPWKLQGYIDKPTWWDAEYLNTNALQWGDRVWKYKHGFELISADNLSNDSVDGIHGSFNISGNFNTVFTTGHSFTIDSSIGSPNNDGTYITGMREIITNVNIGSAGTASIEIDDVSNLATAIYLPSMIFSVIQTPVLPAINNTITKTYSITSVNKIGSIFTIAVAEEILVGDIIPATSVINGALYLPTSNITKVKIAGAVTTSSGNGRLIKSDSFGLGMWENIRIGVIPPNREYPNGIVGVTGNPSIDTLNGLSVPDLPRFSYFSVNIDNSNVSSDGGMTTYAPDGLLPPFWDHTQQFGTTLISFDNLIRTVFFNFSTEIITPNIDFIFGDAGPVEWEWRVSSQFLYDQLTIAYRIDPVRYVSSTFGFNLTTIAGLQIDRNIRNTPSHTRTTFHGDIANNTPVVSNGTNQWYVNFNRFTGYDSNFSDFNQLWTQWTAPLSYQFASFIDTPSLSIGHRFVSISEFDYNIAAKRSPGVNDYWLDAFNVNIIQIPFDIQRYDNQLEWRFELSTNINISREINYYDVRNYQFYANPITNECLLYTWEIESVNAFNKEFTILGDQTYVFSAGREFTISTSSGNDGTYTTTRARYDVNSNTTTITVNSIITSTVANGLITAKYRSYMWDTGDSIYLSTAETLPIPLRGDNANGLTEYFIIKISDTVFKIANTPQDAITNTPIVITSTGRRDQFVGEITSTFLAPNSTTNWRIYRIDESSSRKFNTPYQVQGFQTLIDIVRGYATFANDVGWVFNEDNSLRDPDTTRVVNWQVELERLITYAYGNRQLRRSINDRYEVSVNSSTDIWTFIEPNQSFITGDIITVLSSNSIFPVPIANGLNYFIIRDSITTFRISATRQDALNGIALNISASSGVGTLQISTPNTNANIIQPFELNAFRNAAWLNTPTGIVSNVITGPSEDIRTNQTIFNQNGQQISESHLRVYRQDKQTKIQIIDVDNPVSNNNNPLLSQEYSNINLGGLHLFTDSYEHIMIFNNYNTDGVLLYDPFIGLNVSKYEMLFNKQPEFLHRPSVGGYTIETFFNQGTNLTENIEASIENLRFAHDTYTNLESNLMTTHSRLSLGYEGITDYLLNLNLSEKSQFIFWRGLIQYKGSRNAVQAFTHSRRFIDAQIDDFWAIKVGEFGSVKEKEYPEIFVTTSDARSNELRLEFIDNDALDTSVESTFTPIKLSNEERWYNQPDQVHILRDKGNALFFDMIVNNSIVCSLTPGSPSNLIESPGTFNNKLYIRHDLDADAIAITHFNNTTNLLETLVLGVDYNIINNNIIEYIIGPPRDSITIWGMLQNNDAQSPARIIDHASETQISPIQFFDPARGIHYSNAIHNIDLLNDTDPAQYTNTIKNQPMGSPATTVINSTIWEKSFIGTTWWNTNNLDYVPYYSKEMLPNTTERFRNWGALADWSTVSIFEWVESNVPPDEWDILALSEEGDLSIPEHIRKSGTARRVLFEQNNAGGFIVAVDKIEEQYVATEGTETATTFEFSVPVGNFKETGSPLMYIVDVYINGKLYKENDILTFPYIVDKVNIKEADIIHFVQPIPTDQTIIDAEIIAGNMRQEYEFSRITTFNEIGTEVTTYYFWVENKKTRPINRNRSMSISEAATQLIDIPSAHMFFQEVRPTETITLDDTILPRTELHTVIGGSPIATFYPTDLPIASTTNLLVEVNGVDLPNNGIYFTVGGSPNGITMINPLPSGNNLMAGDIIRISYNGVNTNSLILPYRQTQCIIRGLQGIVNADRRYTIRFTRDFTLRDNLTIVDNDEHIQLNNVHEEWKLFRESQQFNIDRYMWDNITESIVKFKLLQPSVRVPSFERELYDLQYNTDTQYGLEDGQAFVNGELALGSVLGYLNDPNVDFSPIDINAFFNNNSFDTPAEIIIAMDTIYNTFLFTDVNRIFFSVLADAFSTKSKYPGLFKTSMVSLHGVQPFQTALFDD